MRRTEALRLIARRAREVADAGLVMVLLHDEEHGRYVTEVAEGDGAGALAGRAVPSEGTTAEQFGQQGHRFVEDLHAAAEWPGPVPEGPALAAPLTAADSLRGVLIVTQPAGRVADGDDAVLLSTFAGQAALALERARAQEEREQLVVLEDRERIARDLHDVVIQRLFATGMQAQGAVVHAARPEAVKRINAAVDDLDATIRDIRRSIFELRAPVGPSLRAEINKTVQEASEALGFRPVVDTSGPVDSAIPDDIVPELLAVLREALTNVARHAQAATCRVSLRAAGGEVVLRIEDDGVGLDPALTRGGLANMAERAADLGGSFDCAPAQTGSGTLLTWRAPI